MRHRMLVPTTIVNIWLLAFCVAPVAQSLADVARQEQARRKEIKQPAKVYTNKDLVSVPPPAAPAPVAADANATKQPDKDDVAETEAVAAVTAGDGPTEKPRDQAYWSGRMKDLQEQLDRDHTLADALQTRINALTADFSARDDPAVRGVIALNRQKAIDELDRLEKSIQTDQKTVAEFQEEARHAAVPPGWLR